MLSSYFSKNFFTILIVTSFMFIYKDMYVTYYIHSYDNHYYLSYQKYNHTLPFYFEKNIAHTQNNTVKPIIDTRRPHSKSVFKSSSIEISPLYQKNKKIGRWFDQ